MANDETESGFTLRQVRAVLYCWGDVVREHGDNSIDGWGWSAVNALGNRRSDFSGKDELEGSERILSELDRKNLQDVSTIARLIKELRPMRVAVLAYIYVHRLSAKDTALQLGAKIGWVIDLRRETEIALMQYLNGPRSDGQAATANQRLAGTA